MAATYDTTTDIGKVRLLIGDTDVTPESDAHFTDAELQTFLDLEGTVHLAAAGALEAWAASDFDLMDSERIGDYQYARGAVSKKLTLAKLYRTQGENAPVFDWAEMALTDIVEP